MMRPGVLVLSLSFVLVVVSGLEAGGPGIPVRGTGMDPAAWSLAANHLHSNPGGERPWARGISHIAGWCAGKGVEFACLSDHNTIEGWFFPEFRESSGVVMVPGEEWTSSQGHANLVGYRADAPGDAITPGSSGGSCDDHGGEAHEPAGDPGTIDHEAMIREVHDRGGLVIINHPVLRFGPWPDQVSGADACEVGPSLTDFWGKGALEWWLVRLERGHRICALAGSDYHYMRPKTAGSAGGEVAAGLGPIFTPAIDSRINLILAPTLDAAGFMEALRRRHVQVIEDCEAPRLFIGADSDGDGAHDDGIIGDVLETAAGAPVRFQVRVLGGKGRELTILQSRIGGTGSDRRLEVRSITEDDQLLAFEREASGEGSRFVVVWVGGREALANPIWY